MDILTGYNSISKIGRKYLQKAQYLFRRINNQIERRFNLWQFNAIWKAYASPRKWVRNWILPLVQYIQRVGKLIYKEDELSVIVISGKAAPSQQPFKAAYIGKKRSLNYFTFSLFGNNPVERQEIAKTSSKKSRRIAEKLARSTDMVVFERNCLVNWKPGWGDWVEVPYQLRHIFKLTPEDDWQSLEDRFREQKRYIRKAQKENFSITISREKDDFDFFYDNMLVPLAERKYEDRARIAQHEYLAKLFPKGFITFVSTQDGQRIAGAFNIVDGDLYSGMVMGVLNGNEAWIQKGVVALLYQSDIQYCYKNGLKRIDIGESVPFANNGLFRYKAMWGYRPQLDPWNYLNWLIWVPNRSQVALHWIERHQFLPQFSKFSSNYIGHLATES